MNADAIKKQTIDFSNNNQAIAVFASKKAKAEDIIEQLAVGDYQSVILVVGGAESLEQKSKDKLSQLFSRGIARGAIEGRALLIDGGTQAGVMELMGEGVAARGNKTPLIGVAPAGKISLPGNSNDGVALEPNHSHFVIVEGTDWGSETATMFNLVKALTVKNKLVSGDNDNRNWRDKRESTLPSLVILAGGGDVTKKEILRAVREKMRIIVLEETGGLAGELAALFKNKENLPDDPLLAEIVADGDICFHKLTSSVETIQRLIIRELGVDKVLMQAWETFALYDKNAKDQQKYFSNLQMIILLLGVVGTALVIIQQIWGPKDPENVNALMSAQDLWKARSKDNNLYWWLLHNSLIVMPILLSILVTAAARFKQGSKWLLLRAAAESIKREIYRYRTRSMYYKELPEQQLALKIEDITRRTMRTEVNTSSLKPYDLSKGIPPKMDAANGQDDGISFLSPDRYIEVRLDDQLGFFKSKAVRLEKQLKALYWLTFIIGGLGSYLAAVNMQIWVALTTSVVAAFGTYLGYRQTESTLIKYNQALTDLANVKAWWNALSAEEQSSSTNIDSLVSHTEQVLQTDLDGWIQQMQNALAELREDQKKKYEKEGRPAMQQTDGPPVSPNAAPPAASDTVNDTPNEKSTAAADVESQETVEKDGESSDDDDDTTETGTDGKEIQEGSEIEISSTSSATLIGEIEETVQDDDKPKLETV